MKELKWTGERLVTGLTDIHGTIEHLHRYALGQVLAKDKTVLDIASGEGYGSHLLSQVAKFVYGVDISEESVSHAQNKYKTSNLEFKVGSASSIPIENSTIDVIVSFETLEHHDKHREMMQEFVRVLKPDGIVILSSPEKSIYKQRDPINPYHIKELTLPELEKLLSTYFKFVRLFDQQFVYGSLIVEKNNSIGFAYFDGDYGKIENSLKEEEFYNKPFFNLALASNSQIQALFPGSSLFNGMKVLNKEHSQYEALLNSTSFRFGNFFVNKLHFLKRVFKK